MRAAIAAAVLSAALVLSAPSATAAEIHDVQTARSAADPLTKVEAKRVTKYLLRAYIGPAVTSSTDPLSMVAAWGCRVNGDVQGTCRGAVTGGVVTCRGLFRIHKYPKGYAAFPLRMDCEARA